MFPGISIEWRGQDLNLRPSGYERTNAAYLVRGFSPGQSAFRVDRCSPLCTAVYRCLPLFTVVLVHGWYIFRAAGWRTWNSKSWATPDSMLERIRARNGDDRPSRSRVTVSNLTARVCQRAPASRPQLVGDFVDLRACQRCVASNRRAPCPVPIRLIHGGWWRG